MMKRTVFFLALVAMCQSVFAYDFSAVAPSGQTLYYNIVNGEAQVTFQYGTVPGYANLVGHLSIPAIVAYNGVPYSVTSIGIYAFRACGLTSVTIPNSVTAIGVGAFSFCSDLTSVTIPNSVTSIGSHAFSGCSSLTSPVYSNTCFAYLPEAYAGSYTIPSGITTICSYAFFRCSGLTSVTIPNTVDTIGYRAFEGCSGLTSVTIPNTVDTIGDYAFNGCSGLTSPVYNNTCFAYLPAAYAGSYTIPSGITTICGGAFAGCSGLTSVTIPNSVTSIEYCAFVGCSGLTSVTIPNSVTSIHDGAFYGCSALRTVNMLSPVPPVLGNEVFSGTHSSMLIMLNGCWYDAYCNSWNAYCNRLVETILDIDIHTETHDADRGTASVLPLRGHEVVRCDSTAVISATPHYGYHFSHWSNGSTANPDTLHLTGDSTVTAYFIGLTTTTSDETRGTATHQKIGDKWELITATPRYGYHFDHWSNGNTANPDTLHLVGDSLVTAFFAPNQHTITVISADESLGTASGSGTYNYGDTISLTAIATAEHHHFSHWSAPSGYWYNNSNPWRFVVGDYDVTWIANFAIDTHSVSVASNDIARGMVEASGTQFEYGQPCTVTATAYSGYTFHSWSNGMRDNPYTFAVLSDVELTANFIAAGEQVYTITVQSADPTMGTVSGGGQALRGGTLTIRAQGNAGYRFLRWQDGNTDSVRTVTVTGNATYTAYFSETVGIEDVEGCDQSGPRLYPNPAHSSVTVTGLEPGRRIALVDIYGRTLADLRASSTELTIDVSALSPGTYFVRVEGLPARKVVVIN